MKERMEWGLLCGRMILGIIMLAHGIQKLGAMENTIAMFDKIGQPDAVLKKAIADMLLENELLYIRDDDIQDCRVVAMVNGKSRTINVIEAGHFATRFQLEIEDYIKGHPDREKSKAAMLNLLENQIIEKSENV